MGAPGAATPPGYRDRSSGTYYLVVGGIAILIYVVVLAFVAPLDPAVGLAAIIADLALYVVMLVARFALPTQPKQWTLFACFVVASALSLAALLVVIAAQR